MQNIGKYFMLAIIEWFFIFSLGLGLGLGDRVK